MPKSAAARRLAPSAISPLTLFDSPVTGQSRRPSSRRITDRLKREQARVGQTGCEACEAGSALPWVRNGWRLLHMHHIVPLAAGGADSAENIARVCPACHEMADAIGPYRGLSAAHGARLAGEGATVRRTRDDLLVGLRLLRRDPDAWASAEMAALPSRSSRAQDCGRYWFPEDAELSPREKAMAAGVTGEQLDLLPAETVSLSADGPRWSVGTAPRPAHARRPRHLVSQGVAMDASPALATAEGPDLWSAVEPAGYDTPRADSEPTPPVAHPLSAPRQSWLGIPALVVARWQAAERATAGHVAIGALVAERVRCWLAASPPLRPALLSP
jgi:hypothetical protein